MSPISHHESMLQEMNSNRLPLVEGKENANRVSCSSLGRGSTANETATLSKAPPHPPPYPDNS